MTNKTSDHTSVESLLEAARRNTPWRRALQKFGRDRFGLAALIIVLLYAAVAILVGTGVIASSWDVLAVDGRLPPSSTYWFGTNMNGQDIFARAIYSTKTAFNVGLIVAVVSTVIGVLLGALAGYTAGTWIDELIAWFYGCLDSIPFYLFVAAVAFALQGYPLAMHIAMIATFWTTTARLIRGEVLKLRNLEFVEAAHAVGVNPVKILLRHIIPNTSHIALVQASITFISAIKAEVVLSFLGLGIKDSVSWGVMIAEASTEVTAGEFGNFLAASGFMFVLVMAFNMFADSLQDALDPKKIG